MGTKKCVWPVTNSEIKDQMEKQQITLRFCKNVSPTFEGLINADYKVFEIEKDPTNLKKISDQIAMTDVGFRDALNSGDIISWNFFSDQSLMKTRRLKKFAPLVWRSKKYDSALYNYQVSGINFLRNNPKCILADDMGLGKTLQVIKACELEIFEKKISTIFIFCPNALVANWKRELSKWFPLTNFTEYSKQRLSHQKSNFTFIITPYSQIENFSAEATDEICSNAISVFDEAHKLRNEGAQVSKSSKTLGMKYKWLLTGTPLERDFKDIETILQILDPSASLGNFTSDKFFLKSRLKNITLRRTKEDTLKDLPEVHREVHYLTMLGQQSENYEALLREYKGTPKSDKIGMLTKLMIAASCSPSGVSVKIQKAGEIVKLKISCQEKTIVFSKFNSVLDETSRYLFQNNINHVLVYGQIKQDKRDELIRKFQEDDNCFVLVINLSIGSEGLTLTEANNVIFINEAWNPSMNRQAEDRVNRIGQHRPVKIHILRSKATIDISLEKILLSKSKLETEYVNDLLNEVLFVS